MTALVLSGMLHAADEGVLEGTQGNESAAVGLGFTSTAAASAEAEPDGLSGDEVSYVASRSDL